MKPADVDALGRLAGVALAGGGRRISEAHLGIAERVFSAVGRGVGPAVVPVQVVHDTCTRTVHRAVRVALRGGARAAGRAAAALADDAGPDLVDHPAGGFVVGVLNGAHGDLLARDVTRLALPMAVRHHGSDVGLDDEALRTTYQNAKPRIAVFLHGLVETEDAWCYRSTRRHGQRRITYGTLLERDLGFSPVFIRYNTGLRISANGEALSDLLDQLVAHWPVPLDDVVLIGHSMGGLVARSALAQAGDAAWPHLVRDTITLGAPHLGAPLEQRVNNLVHLLRRLPETRWLATSLATRSVGIKDLRHGNLVSADWSSCDPDCRDNHRTAVPLHQAARHFVVLATLVGDHTSRAGDLLGDLLVRPRSAASDCDTEHRFDLPEAHVCRLRGLHHLDLLNHPDVYAAIRRWLAERPAQLPA